MNRERDLEMCLDRLGYFPYEISRWDRALVAVQKGILFQEAVKEEVYIEEAPDQIPYYSIQEISLINELGVITINEKECDVEEIRYAVDDYGVRYAEIYLN